MTFRKSLAILGLIGVMAFIGAADSLSNIRAAGKVRVAIDLASPPNGMLDTRLKPVG